MMNNGMKQRFSSARTDKNVDEIRDPMYFEYRLLVKLIGEKFNLTHIIVSQIFINELRKIFLKMIQKKSIAALRGHQMKMPAKFFRIDKKVFLF